MRRTIVCVVLAVGFLAVSGRAGVIFSDDFESGTLGNWTSVGTALDISTAQNKVPDGGSYSAYLNSSGDGMYHNIGELSGPSTASFWIYDGTATRAWGETRGYSGAGFGDGTLQHLLAIGKYSSTTLGGDPYDGTKYQARASFSTSSILWFNLNAPGAPSRSTGWHLFTIERLADNSTVNFYVDGILGRSMTGVTTDSWDSVLMTSVRSGTTAGDSWYDGIVVTDGLVPEPATFGFLTIGALGLLARRRA